MGYTWEVEVWSNRTGKFKMEHFWRGESFFSALWQMCRARKLGFLCTCLYWRK